MNLVAITSVNNYTDQAFEQLFKTHYKALHAYAHLILKDLDMAEEVVQQLFLKFWEKRELLQVGTSMKAYLYKCVYNDSLNFLKHEKVKLKYHDYTLHTADHLSDSASAKIELGELEIKLREALNELPEQCRTIFQLSRFEELKYREIAEKLNISIKTVENQMGKALRLLRVKLSDFLLLALLGMMYYQDYLN
nr:RNA polymerase sigma-70 factor [Pedobacter sp. ASV12]